MTRTTVAQKRWSDDHAAKYGAPAGTDEKFAVIEHSEFGGRTYQNETHYCNGVVVYSAQYPAGTPYAAKRVARLREIA